LTVFEKLFQEDQPIGGNGTGICFCAFTFDAPHINAAAIITSVTNTVNLHPGSLIASPRFAA
jgi:hypothetical protein